MNNSAQIYADRFHEDEMGHRREIWQVLTSCFFAKYFPPDCRVLDIGAGYCEFINLIEAREKCALDRNPHLREYARPEVRCVVGEIDETLGSIPDASMDRIMASNVFEHLPDRDSLFRCIEQAYRILAPGGRIVVMQPNVAAVREKFYDFCDHLLPLTEKGMAEALRSNGFEIELMTARFLPYTTKSRYPKWKFLVRLYLKAPIVHRLIGGQMLIIARKQA